MKNNRKAKSQLIRELFELRQQVGELEASKIDDLVKSPKSLFIVIPAKAGIQYFHRVIKNLDPVFQRGDAFLRDRQN
jgi:hypothetical protein